METLDMFSQLSGLAINDDKTTVDPIGNWQNKYNKDDFVTTHNMRWSNGLIDTLGFKLPIHNKIDIHKLNYDPKIRELEMLFKVWNMRNTCMCIKGKTTIVESLSLTTILH